MKQKIIIKVSMHCSECRAKALQIAAVADGVASVALHGAEKDKLLIVGEDVDIACLTNALKKKLCYASIETVEEVKENPTPKPPAPKAPTPAAAPDPVKYHLPYLFEIDRVVPDPTTPRCPIM